ncbi:MAG: hypothetical protein JWN86_378 [Planctomycetota bacterium]|nr:hypothetical protein [Planctomycetota bacterium]
MTYVQEHPLMPAYSMSRIVLTPLDCPAVAPRPISERLRSQLVYFGVPSGIAGVPTLGDSEYWFDPAEVSRWLDDGVISLISPLDTANMTEVELSEEQESFLGWLVKEGVKHVRVDGE